MLDLTTPFGARVAKRLQSEQIIWLTTVKDEHTPQPSPVWFLWDGETMLIYSKPGTQKLRSIAANPTVSLNFHTNSEGGDVVIFTGTAQLDPHAPIADALPTYVEKYAAGISRIGMTPQSFAQAYSVALRVTPTKLRGH